LLQRKCNDPFAEFHKPHPCGGSGLRNQTGSGHPRQGIDLQTKGDAIRIDTEIDAAVTAAAKGGM
jgi:hypothetical protein